MLSPWPTLLLGALSATMASAAINIQLREGRMSGDNLCAGPRDAPFAEWIWTDTIPSPGVMYAITVTTTSHGTIFQRQGLGDKRLTLNIDENFKDKVVPGDTLTLKVTGFGGIAGSDTRKVIDCSNTAPSAASKGAASASTGSTTATPPTTTSTTSTASSTTSTVSEEPSTTQTSSVQSTETEVPESTAPPFSTTEEPTSTEPTVSSTSSSTSTETTSSSASSPSSANPLVATYTGNSASTTAPGLLTAPAGYSASAPGLIKPSSSAGTKDNANSDTKSKGLGSGAIAGIVIAVIVGIAALAFLLFGCMKRSNRRHRRGGDDFIGEYPPLVDDDRTSRGGPTSRGVSHSQNDHSDWGSPEMSQAPLAPAASGAAMGGAVAAGSDGYFEPYRTSYNEYAGPMYVHSQPYDPTTAHQGYAAGYGNEAYAADQGAFAAADGGYAAAHAQAYGAQAYGEQAYAEQAYGQQAYGDQGYGSAQYAQGDPSYPTNSDPYTGTGYYENPADPAYFAGGAAYMYGDHNNPTPARVDAAAAYEYDPNTYPARY